MTTLARTPAPAAYLGLRAALTDHAVMAGRSLRLTRRNVDTLVMAVVLPVLQMALFVYVFGGAISGRAAYVDYVVPGIVLLCAGYGAATTAVSVAADATSGMVDRLRSMPVRSSAVLTGHVAASVARNAVSTAVVVAAAVLMGFRPDATVAEWAAAGAVVLLYVLALSWLAAFLGVLASGVESAGAMGFVMLFLPYLSSAFVPPETLPAALRAVAEHQPITPVIETVRGLLTGAPIGSAAWQAVAWSTGLLLVAATAAGWAHRRRT